MIPGSFMDILLLCGTIILIIQLSNFIHHTSNISKKMDEVINIMKTIKITK